MEKKRPYWQVAVSLLFSILATVAFIFIGVKAVLFFMPFVVGWCIASIAVPVVNWLEKKFNIVKKLGSALVVIVVIAIIVAIFYFAISRKRIAPDRRNIIRFIFTPSGKRAGWLEYSDSESGSDDGGFSEKSKRTNNGSSRKFR